MKFSLILVVLFFTFKCMACECPEITYSGKHVRQFYYWYDKIFIGNLLESEKDIYRFEVIRPYKKCQFRDAIWGKYNNSCSIFSKEKGLWMVYASIQDSLTNEIDIDACNQSRSLASGRQYLNDGYDNDSELYQLKEEQSYK